MTDKTVEEVEKEVVEETRAEEFVKDPVEAAATMYGLYAPKFIQGVKRLSSRGRTRVLKALIEYPLNEKKYEHSTPLEKEMMSVGHAVLEAKFLMIMATMYHHMPDLEAAADPNTPVNLTDEEKKELEGFMSSESVERGLADAKKIKGEE